MGKRYDRALMLAWGVNSGVWWLFFLHQHDRIGSIGWGFSALILALSGLNILYRLARSQPLWGRDYRLVLRGLLFYSLWLLVFCSAFSVAQTGGEIDTQTAPWTWFAAMACAGLMGAWLWSCFLGSLPYRQALIFFPWALVNTYCEQTVNQQAWMALLMGTLACMAWMSTILLGWDLFFISKGSMWALIVLMGLFSSKRYYYFLRYRQHHSGWTWPRVCLIHGLVLSMVVLGGGSFFSWLGVPVEAAWSLPIFSVFFTPTVIDVQWLFLVYILLSIPLLGRLWDPLRPEQSRASVRMQELVWGERGRSRVEWTRYFPRVLRSLMGLLLAMGLASQTGLILYTIPLAGMGFLFLLGAFLYPLYQDFFLKKPAPF